MIRFIPIAVFFSGAAALTYQFVWLRSFSVIFGGTTQAASVVLAVFMGGLALGSALSRKIKSDNLLRTFALVELGMGATALLTLPLLRALPSVYGGFLQGHPLPEALELVFRIALAGLVVLPTTVLSGATMPLAVEILARHGKELPSNFGQLYRLNTLGAAAGVLLGTFVLIPRFGQALSLGMAAMLNLTVGVLAWTLSRRALAGLAPDQAAAPSSGGSRLLAWAALGTGASAFVLELLWMRSFSLILGSSVYALQLTLLALLLGMVLGTFAFERLWKRWADPQAWLIGACLALAVAVLAQVWFIGQLPAIFIAMIRRLPPSFVSYQVAGLALCFLVLLPVTFLQGALFPMLTLLPGPASRSALEDSGRLYAWNTTGAILGALGAGFYLIEAYGLQASYVVAVVPPLALGLALLGQRLELSANGSVALFTGMILALALLGNFYRPWDPYVMSSGPYIYGRKYLETMPATATFADHVRSTGELLFYKEGREALVTARSYGEVHSLQINGKTDASYGSDSITQKLVGHLPLLAHPGPRRALVIGWGSGTTAASAHLHELEQLDCVEIEPATFEAASFFDLANFGLRPGGNFALHFQDGRNFLLKSPRPYDVIISEPSNPWILGNASLFTLEYYEVARSRLAPGGVFGQWFHIYAMAGRDIQDQFKTFCQAFPHASLWIVPRQDATFVTGDLLMLGTLQEQAVDFKRFQGFFDDPRRGSDLQQVGIQDPLSLASTYVMDRPDMLAYAGAASLNTDDHPRLEFSSPRQQYLTAEQGAALTRENCLAIGNAASAWLPPLANFPASTARPVELAAMYLTLARLYREKWLHKKYESTMHALLKLEPGQKEATDELGKWYYGSQRYEQSRQVYAGRVLKQPRDAEALFGLGASLAQLRDWAGARSALMRCLAIEPRHDLAQKFLDQMNENIRAEGGKI